MCGLSAIIDTGPLAGPLLPALSKMHAALAHRGPDGEGVLWLDGALQPGRQRAPRLESLAVPVGARAAAAFRWLKIQDLDERSAQPMASADEQLWVLFNGEIYNHAALRATLESEGERFRTASDTEVILAAYRRWGCEAFARMQGMWALVIFDLGTRSAILSRDRLGIKPLYYAFDGTRLLIASEPKAIARPGVFEPRVQAFRLHEFLRGMPPQSAGLTFFEGVHPLPAGTWARVPLDGPGLGALAPVKFWDLAEVRTEDLDESAFEPRRAAFEALLLDAVDSHARAAVDVGALLSGGMDTSMLARMLAARAGSAGAPSPKAYSIIFEDPAMSEWPYMQLVLAQGGLEGHNEVLTADTAWQSTPQVVEAQGQPLLGQDTVAQFHAYGLARRHGSTVVVEGQGADELLAGLPSYDAQVFPDLLRQGRLLRAASEFRARRAWNRMTLRQAAAVFLASPFRRQRMEAHGLPHHAWLDREHFDSSEPGPGREVDGGPERDNLTRFLYRHVRHTNLPAALMHQDRSSMAHAVEARVPFLDHRLVEFAFRLPASFKVLRGMRKRILAETARRHLPDAVVNRRDKRMFISRSGWMELRTRHAAELREMAASPEMRGFALLRPAALTTFVEDFLAGRHADERSLWRLYTLWLWLVRFRPGL